jgi:multicomponent Na+:H+ antiporter subunit G
MNEINDAIVGALLVLGSVFMLLAAIGVVRMPDVYMRLSTATKAATLGVGCALLAVAVHFSTVSITSRAIAILVFIFITAPVGAHVMGRAAYMMGIALWEGTAVDELRGRYDHETGQLRSPTDAEELDTPTSV